MSPKEARGHVHWKSPTIVLSSFIAALAFALGHHAFYLRLSGSVVDAEGGLFDQQVNIAIGTGFAFLFRACLIVTVGAVYWQVFWGTIIRKAKSLPLSDLDSLAGILGSLLEFSNLRALMSNPGLTALALLCWLLPLAALLPPATLAVETVSQTEYTFHHVPALNFSAEAMFQRGYLFDEVSGPGPELSRLATATAYQSTVMQPPAIAVNSSYKSQFLGPAVRCEPISSEDLAWFQNYMETDCPSHNWTQGAYIECGLNRIRITYIAWPMTPLPYVNFSDPNGDQRRPPLLHNGSRASGKDIMDTYPTERQHGSSSIIVATKAYSGKGEFRFSPNKWEVINCTLYEAMYAMDVPSSANGGGSFANLTVEVRALQYYEIYDKHQGYFAIMDCLIKLVKGHVVDQGGNANLIEAVTDITQTSLMFTRPLLYTARVRNVNESWAIADAIRGVYKVWPEEAFASSHFNRSLAGAIEELSHNLTLSLFSRPAFLKEVGDRVEVAFDHWSNVYAYRQANLIASYSTALGLSLLACIAGCVSIYRNGASYSNLFSTMLRTTRGHIGTFDDILTAKDKDGADPLPKHLAMAQIELGGQREMASDGGGTRIELQQRFDAADEQSSMISRSEGEEGVRSSRSASLS